MNQQLIINTRSSIDELRLSVAIISVLLLFSFSAVAQNDTPSQVRIRAGDDKNDPDSNTVQEMVIKQQISRRKKEYEDMLKQGDEAVKLSQELQTSFESRENLSNQDLQKLQELEKVVSKIREELGGNGEEDEDTISADNVEIEARKSTPAAFKFLRETTIKLVEELKKSTRFSISVTAIQASNSVIKFARFLRLKK